MVHIHQLIIDIYTMCVNVCLGVPTNVWLGTCTTTALGATQQEEKNITDDIVLLKQIDERPAI